MKSKTLIQSYRNLRVRKQKNKSGTFTIYFDIVKDGKRIREVQKGFTLTGDKKGDAKTIDEVKRIAELRSTAISEKKNGLTDTTKSKADFVEFFDLMMKKRNKLRTWDNALRHFRIFTKNKPLAFCDITPLMVEQWKEYLVKSPKLSQNSADMYFQVFKTALNDAVRLDIIAVNPCYKVKSIGKRDTHREYLTESELSILEQAPISEPFGEVKRAFLFSCYTGLRLSDVKTLQWNHIYETEHGFEIVKEQVKTKDVVRVPLNNHAIRHIGERGKAKFADKVFALRANDEHTRKHLKRWIAQSGITKNISFHCARHTYATFSLTLGVNIFEVSKLIGHKNIKHTQVYAKIIDEKLYEAGLKMNAVTFRRDSNE